MKRKGQTALQAPAEEIRHSEPWTAKLSLAVSGIALACSLPATLYSCHQLSDIQSEREKAETLLAQSERQVRSVEHLADVANSQLDVATGIRQATQDVASETAKSTLSTVDVTKRNFEASQRALLSVPSAEIEDLELNQPIITDITVENLGVLPARRVRFWLAQKLLPHQSDIARIKSPVAPSCDQIRNNQSVTLGRVTNLRMPTGNVTDALIRSVANGQLLAAYGAICYNDGFGHERQTRFCAMQQGEEYGLCPNGQ